MPTIAASPLKPELTVIIPAYNEAKRLPAALESSKRFLDAWGVDYRVVVVDNGSRDGTAEVALGFGWRFSTISEPTPGKGAAVRKGMLSASSEILAFTDADLPYDLSALRLAVEAIRAKRCSVVFGARDLPESENAVVRSITRSIATVVFRLVTRAFISRIVVDTQCGLKVFERHAALEIFSHSTIDGFAFDAEVIYLTETLRIPFERIPVRLINDYSSSISVQRQFVPMLRDVLRVRWRHIALANPLTETVAAVRRSAA